MEPSFVCAWRNRSGQIDWNVHEAHTWNNKIELKHMESDRIQLKTIKPTGIEQAFYKTTRAEVQSIKQSAMKSKGSSGHYCTHVLTFEGVDF